MGLLCLAAVHSHVCSRLGLDKKLTKSMLDLHNKVPGQCCPHTALPCPAPHLCCPALVSWWSPFCPSQAIGCRTNMPNVSLATGPTYSLCCQVAVIAKAVVSVQIPLLPVYCNLSIHPASFLSKMLHATADKYISGSYVREVIPSSASTVAAQHPFCVMTGSIAGPAAFQPPCVTLIGLQTTSKGSANSTQQELLLL